ncbi:hypothetical protein BDF22DRAFT_696281 [Syncephalis plumigaleata]|nr:hypothetical protein BDF22DRAFT_696281 [Syncephalis plumigaleata]
MQQQQQQRSYNGRTRTTGHGRRGHFRGGRGRGRGGGGGDRRATNGYEGTPRYSIPRLDNPEEIAQWIAERKRKYPLKDNEQTRDKTLEVEPTTGLSLLSGYASESDEEIANEESSIPSDRPQSKMTAAAAALRNTKEQAQLSVQVTVML